MLGGGLQDMTDSIMTVVSGLQNNTDALRHDTVLITEYMGKQAQDKLSLLSKKTPQKTSEFIYLIEF